MDDLISLLVVVFSVVGLLNKSAKKKARSAAAQKAFRDLPPVSAPQAVTQQAAAAPSATMLPPRPAYQTSVLADENAAEGSLQSYEGRAGREGKTDHSAHISCEGHDPCHEDQLRPAVRPARVAVMEIASADEPEAPSLTLNFTGDELVRAFVMKEVLTRPCERRHRTI